MPRLSGGGIVARQLRLCDPEMNHDELVRRAGKWLRKSMRCRRVLLERSTIFSMEIPDAIGFIRSTGGSILVECKITKSDFSSDRSKIFRKKPELGMGEKRYFMVDKDFEIPGSLPDNWGLLRVYPKQVRKITESGVFVANKNAEVTLLC